jgi:hypothetical protein
MTTVTLRDDQLDGLACLRCGHRGGHMAPLPIAPVPSDPHTPRSQLFAHPDCLRADQGESHESPWKAPSRP